MGAKKRKVWTRIGQAYPHDTGAGLTLILDLIPLDGVVILLERYDDDDAWLQSKVSSPKKRRTTAS
ncbi:MAG: hypothetical protein EBS23_02790 [Betaproteobacteria bacterium]|nr:hypothetical protein [Betaproteobacteria bacterium]